MFTFCSIKLLNPRFSDIVLFFCSKSDKDITRLSNQASCCRFDSRKSFEKLLPVKTSRQFQVKEEYGQEYISYLIDLIMLNSNSKAR